MTVENLRQQPFAHLGEEMKEKRTAIYSKSKPVFIQKLQDRMKNFEEVGRLIGVSGVTVAGYLRDEEASMSAELAARWVFEDRYPAASNKKAKQTVAIIRGDLGHIKTIEDMVRALGGDFQHIGEF